MLRGACEMSRNRAAHQVRNANILEGQRELEIHANLLLVLQCSHAMGLFAPLRRQKHSSQGKNAGQRPRFYQWEDGKTWDRKGIVSICLMAMLSGVAMFMFMFMFMGVVMATGWAMFMDAVAGMLTDAMFTGPVMVTGCCRLRGDVMLTVLVEMFIWAAIVTEWLVLPRFIAVVFMAVAETGVVEAELQTSVLSVEHGERDRRSVRACVGDVFPNSLGI